MRDFLTELNPRQREAVTHGDGPLLIFAGAGSGKTRVLTYRIAYLISARRINPWNILAVTFTNKAAHAMRERIVSLIGSNLRGMLVGTFHSICSQILRQHGERIGVPRDFVVFDEGDQQSVIRECLKDLNLDENRYRPAGISNSISNAKNELMTPRQFQQNAKTFWEEKVADIYARYQLKLELSHALDFDDLLMRAVDLLRENAETRDRFQERFQQVLVDEYQDINFAQYRLVESIARRHRNICVVGDDDQSIYRWRGADVRLILQFEKDYPDAKIVKLEQNYRSTQSVLDAAYHVIRRNAHRAEKRLWTERPGGEKIVVHDAADAVEEAWFVAQTAQRICQERNGKGNLPWRDFAILARTNAQTRVFEETFAQLRIPLRLIGAQRFYERKEIKDVVGYLRLLANPNDGISLRRIINVPPRGIGERTLERLELEAQTRGWSLMDVLQWGGINTLLDRRAAGAVAGFVDLYQRLQDISLNSTITELVNAILAETGYVRMLESERTLESASRLENLNEFLTTATQFDESRKSAGSVGTETEILEEDAQERALVDFLQRTALISDLDAWNENDNAVTMMTVHSAKGLEFPVVFIVGMEEGLFPHARSMGSGDSADIEEERRLCYVALTRAKDQVFLTYAHRRTIQGQTLPQIPSRFLEEMPSELLIKRNEVGWHARKTEWESPELRGLDLQRILSKSKPMASSNKEFRIGDKVRHAQWGEGLVVRVSREDEKTRWVEVAFPKTKLGIKKLDLEYAPIERV